jgi:hypothetical protein
MTAVLVVTSAPAFAQAQVVHDHCGWEQFDDGSRIENCLHSVKTPSGIQNGHVTTTWENDPVLGDYRTQYNFHERSRGL